MSFTINLDSAHSLGFAPAIPIVFFPTFSFWCQLSPAFHYCFAWINRQPHQVESQFCHVWGCWALFLLFMWVAKSERKLNRWCWGFLLPKFCPVINGPIAQSTAISQSPAPAWLTHSSTSEGRQCFPVFSSLWAVGFWDWAIMSKFHVPITTISSFNFLFRSLFLLFFYPFSLSFFLPSCYLFFLLYHSFTHLFFITSLISLLFIGSLHFRLPESHTHHLSV